MHCVSLAELTIFFCFHSVRMIFFLFCHVVITLFTFRTCQCDFYAHDFHLHCVFAFSVIADVCGGLFLCGRQRSYPLFLCIKKRPSSMSLFDYITIFLPRQEFFEGGRPGSGGSGRLWAGFADSLLTPAFGQTEHCVRPVLGGFFPWFVLSGRTQCSVCPPAVARS